MTNQDLYRQKGNAQLLIILVLFLLLVIGAVFLVVKQSSTTELISSPTPTPVIVSVSTLTPNPTVTATPSPTPMPNTPLLDKLHLNVDNFPVIDGATATQPIRGLLLSRALKIGYEWQMEQSKEMFIYPNYYDDYFLLKSDGSVNYDLYEQVSSKNLNSKTHEAYLSLINIKVDLILNATEPSKDEKAEADKHNVKLELTPIALDGFVFLINSDNPINNLTTQNLKDIYTGKITNWKQLGGLDMKIEPLLRQKNSGSQELMEKIFMKGQPIKDFPVEIISMMELVEGVDSNKAAIGYSLYYYKNAMVDRLDTNPLVKIISVDGVSPDTGTISRKKYPYVFNIYAVTRSDQDKNSLVYKIKQWLVTSEGQDLVKEAGYSPLNK